MRSGRSAARIEQERRRLPGGLVMAPQPLERLHVVAGEGVREADRPAIDAQRGQREGRRCPAAPERMARSPSSGTTPCRRQTLEREPPIGILRVGIGIAGHHRQLAILRGGPRPARRGRRLPHVRNSRPPTGTRLGHRIGHRARRGTELLLVIRPHIGDHQIRRSNVEALQGVKVFGLDRHRLGHDRIGAGAMRCRDECSLLADRCRAPASHRPLRSVGQDDPRPRPRHLGHDRYPPARRPAAIRRTVADLPRVPATWMRTGMPARRRLWIQARRAAECTGEDADDQRDQEPCRRRDRFRPGQQRRQTGRIDHRPALQATGLALRDQRSERLADVERSLDDGQRYSVSSSTTRRNNRRHCRPATPPGRPRRARPARRTGPTSPLRRSAPPIWTQMMAMPLALAASRIALVRANSVSAVMPACPKPLLEAPTAMMSVLASPSAAAEILRS